MERCILEQESFVDELKSRLYSHSEIVEEQRKRSASFLMDLGHFFENQGSCEKVNHRLSLKISCFQAEHVYKQALTSFPSFATLKYCVLSLIENEKLEEAESCLIDYENQIDTKERIHIFQAIIWMQKVRISLKNFG